MALIPTADLFAQVEESLRTLPSHVSCVERGESCGHFGCSTALEALAALRELRDRVGRLDALVREHAECFWCEPCDQHQGIVNALAAAEGAEG